MWRESKGSDVRPRGELEARPGKTSRRSTLHRQTTEIKERHAGARLSRALVNSSLCEKGS